MGSFCQILTSFFWAFLIEYRSHPSTLSAEADLGQVQAQDDDRNGPRSLDASRKWTTVPRTNGFVLSYFIFRANNFCGESEHNSTLKVNANCLLLLVIIIVTLHCSFEKYFIVNW